MVEPNPAEPHRRLALPSPAGDDHDGPFAVEEGPRPAGVLAAQADVDAAEEVRSGEIRRVPRIEQLRAGVPEPAQLLDGEGVEPLLERALERGTLPCVEDGVVGKVCRRVRLIGGDDRDERVPAHRLERVVVPTLDPHRRDGLLADAPPAERSRPVGRIHQRLVGKREQLVPE